MLLVQGALRGLRGGVRSRTSLRAGPDYDWAHGKHQAGGGEMPVTEQDGRTRLVPAAGRVTDPEPYGF